MSRPTITRNHTTPSPLGMIFAILTTLVGLGTLAYTLFGLHYQYHQYISAGTHSYSSSGEGPTLWQNSLQQTTLIFLCILILACLGVAISAIMLRRTKNSVWHTISGISTALIAIFVFLSLPSIGLFFIPCFVFAALSFGFSFD